MLRNNIIFHRYSLLAMLLVLSTVVVQAQSGGGVDNIGTGGRHSISGRLVFPSGQRVDYRLKVKLEATGQGDLTVLSDINGNFSFRALTAGSYYVIIDGGDYFETIREAVYIDPGNVNPRTAPVMVPISRPITLQIYLRAKQAGPQAKPGVLNAALANVPKPAIEAYDKGMEAAGKDDVNKAIENLKHAVELAPTFALALNELGVQYLRKGELDKAAEVLAKALQVSPGAPEPLLNYGIVLLQQRKFDEAEPQLRAAVNKNENAFTAHMYLGITMIHFKKYTEAETELRKAIELGGAKAGKAHYYLGGLYWQTGSFRQAADELDTYLKLEPKAANADKVKTTVKELRSKS